MTDEDDGPVNPFALLIAGMSRTEPRGPFPVHDPRPGVQLTGPAAAALARVRLAHWRAHHGY